MAHGLNASQKENRLGFDYWGKRPGNKGGCNCPTKHKATKKITHRKERRIADNQLRNCINSVN